MAAKQKGVEAPRIDLVDPQDLSAGDSTTLRDRESHDAELFEGVDLTDVDLEGSSYSECRFESVLWGGAKLRGARFVESVLVEPFAPELSAARTTWRNVRVERPRWGSAELFDSELRGVRVEGGKIDYLNLRSATLEDVLLEGCSIGELDLGGVRATRVALVDCRIGTLDVTRATFSSVDLRGATFETLNGIEGLRGAVVDEFQVTLLAPLMAAQLGLVVA
ncbi:hypothetical protein AX769_19365 [Frondihabitans sp. PAMC 28766]|uniref:pentapeptide repeat-containing protein n=1 Tax=Frondihabitans sp. PAMC 28766 TaxID=1795630 RepID=UPI00078EA993|nr:pentapeptide repeat-containing protein [Frondihabitans sp. PAMC 28766]AMM21909.1 hypothetical protein AX769_19365 [Frondihabitans sp. PAMC 28766]